MNIEQLQYVCMVAKTNSITVAAENLYVTQQTISKAINKLEQELGVVLLLRSHKGVQLTEVGRAFVEKASRIVRDYQDLYESTRVVADGSLHGEVQIYQSNYVSHVVGVRFLSGMRRRYPKLHVVVEEFLTAEVLRRLQEGERPVALIQTVNHNCGSCMLEEMADWLEWEFLFRDTLVACVAENGPLAKRESIRLRELLKYPVVWGEGYHIADIMLRDYGVNAKVLLNSNNTAMQRSAILEGAGVSFATELLIHAEDFDISGFKILPIRENMRLETFLIRPKGYTYDKAQMIAIEELKAALQRL